MKIKNDLEENSTDSYFMALNGYSGKVPVENNTNGNIYLTLEEFWQKELSEDYLKKEKENPALKSNFVGNRVGGKEQWHNKAIQYWDKMAVTIDGVTGGYGAHHQREAEYSAGIYR